MPPNQESVAAVVRLRPRLQSSSSPTLSFTCSPTAVTVRRSGSSEERSYSFTAVYDSQASHDTLYSEQLSQLVLKPLQGINATVFAYGHTGAGKTHTMLGTKADPGLIPRSVRSLLSMAAFHSSQGAVVQISMSYLEVYNEKIFDLLVSKSAKPAGLNIRQDFGHNMSVHGLSEVPLTSFESFQNAFEPASEKRTTASTKLNNQSSRSHAVLILKVKHTDSSGRQLSGKLHLIDLAGSENAKRAGNVGDRLKESGAINTSLFALSQVVNVLTSGKPNAHIPYRDSKLTRLLQDSLGGTASAVVIANIAPEESHLTDTLSTLQFATRSMQIVNRPVACEKQGSAPTAAQSTSATSGPVVAPRLDALPSPFVRHTKALLSDEMKSMNSILLRDQEEMKSVIDRLTQTVALLASQQTQAVDTGNGRQPHPQSRASSDLCRRPLHADMDVSSTSTNTLPQSTTSSFDSDFNDTRDVGSAPDADLVKKDSSTGCGPGAGADNGGENLTSCRGTFVVDRHRAKSSIPFCDLVEPSNLSSPLLPAAQLPHRSISTHGQPTGTGGKSTGVSQPRSQVSSSANQRGAECTQVAPCKSTLSSRAGPAPNARPPPSIKARPPLASRAMPPPSEGDVPGAGASKYVSHAENDRKASRAPVCASGQSFTDDALDMSPSPLIVSKLGKRRCSVAFDPTYMPPSDNDFMSPDHIPLAQRRKGAGKKTSTNGGPRTAITAAKKRRKSLHIESSSLATIHGTEPSELQLEMASCDSLPAVDTAMDTGDNDKDGEGQATATASGNEKQTKRKAKSRRSVVVAVEWENDIESAGDMPSVTSVIGAGSENIGEGLDGKTKPSRKGKKRLISRKALRQNVMDTSPGMVTRRPLQPVNATVQPSAVALGSATAKDISSAATSAISPPTAQPINSSAGRTTVAPGRENNSTGSVTTVVAKGITPVAKVAPFVIPDSIESLGLDTRCAGSGSSVLLDGSPQLFSNPSGTGEVDTPAADCAKVCVKDSQWSSEETKALSEAQALYPAGQRFIPVAGEDGRTKKVGRNVLISAYISKKTGRTRTAQQVSRRIRILSQRKEKDHGETPETRDELKARIELLEKIAAETKKVFNDRISEMMSGYRTALGSMA